MTILEVRMKLAGDGLSSLAELALRHKFQDSVEARGIGADQGGGSGLGEMDVWVEVSEPEVAKRKLRLLAEELGMSSVEIDEVTPR